MEESRIKNSARNLFVALFTQVFISLLGFASRTFFIKIIGENYLGISAVLNSTIAMFNLIDLGIGSAIVYSMYEPVAKQDYKQVNALMNFYKRIYSVLGIILLIIGIMFIPFLKNIVNVDIDNISLLIIYLLSLLQSVFSYLFYSYKSTFLIVNQKSYVRSTIDFFVKSVTYIMQIIVMILFVKFGPKNEYIIYCFILFLAQIVNNIIVKNYVDKHYPYILGNNTIDKYEMKIILKNAFGASIYKISDRINNSADTIIISMYISTLAVGLYSNYLYVIQFLTTFTNQIFASFLASIGNLIAIEKNEKKLEMFNALNFFCFFVFGNLSILLMKMLNIFIEIWIGDKYIINNYIVVFLVLNFLFEGLQQPIQTFRNAGGLYWQGKIRPVFSVIINVSLSIILVKYFGIAGVIVATIISRILTTWWYDACLVYRNLFKTNVLKYFKDYIKYIVYLLLVSTLINSIPNLIEQHSWITFLATGILYSIFLLIVFFIVFKKNPNFKYLINSINRLIRK